jgi:DNA gyrase/topoisomerase IV subunit B
MKQASKEIQVLSDFEHIVSRPTLYVGSVKISEENIPIVRDGKLCMENRKISVGMYKLFDEIFSNCVDEAKRMKKAMPFIKVEVDSKTNKITITDSGDGFQNGSAINSKSGMSNIATAVSMLRAGSNFDNDGIEETLVGTNGMGVSLVNALSSYFWIKSTNASESYEQSWDNFVSSKATIKKQKKSQTGTSVAFLPRADVFDSYKWDKEIIFSTLFLKKRVLQSEDRTEKLKIEFWWDGKEIDVTPNLPEYLSFKHPLGELLISGAFEGSGTISFVNSAICSGVHIKIVQDQINKVLDDSLAHHFYDMLFILNLPPMMVRFGDQNKTRFVTKREEIETTILHSLGTKLSQFYRTPLFKSIQKEVEVRKRSEEIKKIRREKKMVKVKHSHKYFPPTTKKAESLYIVEGLSACGSILQKRNPQKEGVYALKGKIKNARSLNDLSTNREILELMQILNLDPDSPQLQCPFENVVIATDSDPDGYHIRSLLINLFYNWFPWLVEQGRVHLLETPLISIGDRARKYFYSMEDFKNFSGQKTHVRYLKGLGSLALSDWEHVMENKLLVQIRKDAKSTQNLEMAFGKLSSLRKDWLSAE